MWAPRSPYEQAEYPRPRDRFAEAVRRALPKLLFGYHRTVMPYKPAGIVGTFGRLLVSSRAPVAVPPAGYRYTGEAYLRMLPELDIPHPSGLDPRTRLVAPSQREEEGRG